MLIKKRYSFAVLFRPNSSSSRSIRIVRSLSQALALWESSTRISPVFGIQLGDRTSPDEYAFPGVTHLLFLGLTSPEQILDIGEDSALKVWLTLGLYNLMVLSPTKSKTEKALKWASDQHLPYEVWSLKNGEIRSNKSSHRSGQRSDDIARLVEFAKVVLPSELTSAAEEYLPLLSSTLCRSERMPKALTEGFRAIDVFMQRTIKEKGNRRPYVTLGQLLSVNAGLSHFSSQAFAGTSPIQETECHFWSNSLLGVGVPILGLWKLIRFFEATLGNARLPERFALFSQIRKNIPDLADLSEAEQFWEKDHLGSVELNENRQEPLIPLITYFSARDGFRSTQATLSVPLATIASCNSVQWSLSTVTHEISHVIVSAVLSELYPDTSSATDLAQVQELLEPTFKATNLWDEIRCYLLYAILAIDGVEHDERGSRELTADDLAEILETWHREVEELLVHAFDFMYFYRMKPEEYIRTIWISWGTIPNINNRVPEYVVRTITTMLLLHSRRANAEYYAKEYVRKCLLTLKGKGHKSEYINRAIEYIQSHWDDEIIKSVKARRDIVRIARTFLYSENISADLWREPNVKGRAPRKREGYALIPRSLTLKGIRNPLRFIELYGGSMTPSPLISAWMFYVLAFCIEEQ